MQIAGMLYTIRCCPTFPLHKWNMLYMGGKTMAYQKSHLGNTYFKMIRSCFPCLYMYIMRCVMGLMLASSLPHFRDIWKCSLSIFLNRKHPFEKWKLWLRKVYSV